MKGLPRVEVLRQETNLSCTSDVVCLRPNSFGFGLEFKLCQWFHSLRFSIPFRFSLGVQAFRLQGLSLLPRFKVG